MSIHARSAAALVVIGLAMGSAVQAAGFGSGSSGPARPGYGPPGWNPGGPGGGYGAPSTGGFGAPPEAGYGMPPGAGYGPDAYGPLGDYGPEGEEGKGGGLNPRNMMKKMPNPMNMFDSKKD